MHLLQPRAMVQVGCTPPCWLVRDLHYPLALALGCVNPILTSTLWCNLYQYFRSLFKFISIYNSTHILVSCTGAVSF